ncbi:G-type lectin S-receptor-like serine/threonine-protein kinase LECRK3 [Pistacia vera]|uniref:G-type lectin S-receptor-like serine/threonine-protein kinase LECRK3 n=1 Tax=Pistacia vera TaxID=55513 RepID=UPI0012638E28|nr:G-type lectin S-receptor-like serine/threonine-protein kinase LECRK3 [Pistacia vera]
MQTFHILLMHSIFFLLSAPFKANAQQTRFNIGLGSSLAPTKNSSWPSRSGLYAFGFYRQRKGYAVGIFLAGIPEKTVVWTANRDDPPVSSNATLLLNSEGRLVLQSTEGSASIAKISRPAASASMLDSGNFVLYNTSGGIIWQSFDHPTDTILQTQSLLTGKELLSSVSGTEYSRVRFRLKMQYDGNLVQYPENTADTSTYAYWASNTGLFFTNGSAYEVKLDVDGHLYMVSSIGLPVKNITEGGYPTNKGTIYLVKIDWDGILRLYTYNLRQNGSRLVVWESLEDKCVPKGLCGLNSYCIIKQNQKFGCICLEGFVYVDQENQYSGCQRNSSNRHGAVNYTIQELDNYYFEDVSYKVLQVSKEDCKQACLEDSDCEAALFSTNGNCRMQKLPLRFAGKDPNVDSSNIVLVKVEVTSSSTDSGPVELKESKKHLPVDMIIIVCSLFVAFIFVIFAIFGFVIYRYHCWSYRRILDDCFCEDIAPTSFSFAEIEKMTEGFKEEIGRGSSGTVYKGTMMNCQKLVAVKKLKKGFAEEEREFLTEIKVIGRTHHRNLVRLLGYSSDGPKKVLVYEYMSNGSLADLLFTPEKQPNWVERIGIVHDIARGILYLHDECETQIIHCDIKPHNILMDEKMHAKISDFGLAKLMKPDQTKTYTAIRGTRGYVAPEWHRNIPVTVKADVYSFGIVFLQIICRRRSMDENLPNDQVILEDWAYKCFDAGELIQLVGDEKVDLKQLERMMKIALWCIIDEPSLRPSMKKVLLMLEGTVDFPMPPNPISYLRTI